MKKLMTFFFCIKLLWNAKWGNKTSATVSGAYWLMTYYVSKKSMPRYFDHKHEYYNASAGSGVLLECSKCGLF